MSTSEELSSKMGGLNLEAESAQENGENSRETENGGNSRENGNSSGEEGENRERESQALTTHDQVENVSQEGEDVSRETENDSPENEKNSPTNEDISHVNENVDEILSPETEVIYRDDLGDDTVSQVTEVIYRETGNDSRASEEDTNASIGSDKSENLPDNLVQNGERESTSHLNEESSQRSGNLSRASENSEDKNDDSGEKENENHSDADETQSHSVESSSLPIQPAVSETLHKEILIGSRFSTPSLASSLLPPEETLHTTGKEVLIGSRVSTPSPPKAKEGGELPRSPSPKRPTPPGGRPIDPTPLEDSVTPTPSTPFPPLGSNPPPTTSSSSRAVQQIFPIKWILFRERRVPILIQTENGPCPIIAAMNTLFLRGKATIGEGKTEISADELVQMCADYMLDHAPKNASEAEMANYEHQVNEAMQLLPTILKGLDMNIGFTHVTNFEFTDKVSIFDLMDLTVYHGWLYHPTEERRLADIIGNKTYNQITSFICDNVNSADEDKASDAAIAKYFVTSGSQLTKYGIHLLKERLYEGELSVIFRNNHFTTILKLNGELYVILTDVAFQHKHNHIWETLDVEGDSNWVNANFNPSAVEAERREPSPLGDDEFLKGPSSETQSVSQQMLNDHGLAKQLHRELEVAHTLGVPGMSDEEYAKQLQLHEDEQAANLVDLEERRALEQEQQEQRNNPGNAENPEQNPGNSGQNPGNSGQNPGQNPDGTPRSSRRSAFKKNCVVS